MIKLDLCCGPTKPEGFYGIDMDKFPGVDLVYDLNETIPYAFSTRGYRVSADFFKIRRTPPIIPLDDSSCEVIRAHDAIEHISDGYNIMKEIWRVGIDGTEVDIFVPSTDGRGAFQDQTHKSFWNQNSFGYWINDAQWVDYYRGPCLFKCDVLYTTTMSDDQVCHVVFKAKVIKNEKWMKTFSDRNPK